MRVLILSARTGWHTDELCRALAARGHQPRLAPYESLVAHLGQDSRAAFVDADVVLARIIPNGSLEQIIYRVDALHWIEDQGIPVVNSARAMRQHDELKSVPIVALTGFGRFYAMRALDAGCDDLVSKPIDFRRLEPLVNRHLGN